MSANKIVNIEEETVFYETAQSTDDDEQPIKAGMKIVSHELDRLKTHIQAMQNRLKSIIIQCPEGNSEDLELWLSSREEREIFELKKNQEILQNQINELRNNCADAKEQIKDLRMRMFLKARQILKLQKMIVKMVTIKDSLECEIGKFVKRFEFVSSIKAVWERVLQKFDSQKVYYSQLEQSFVPRAYFLEEKKYFMASVNEIKALVKAIFVYQSCRVRDLDDRLASKSIRECDVILRINVKTNFCNKPAITLGNVYLPHDLNKAANLSDVYVNEDGLRTPKRVGL
ncbi:hypothetical protein GQX74_005222 [Glossina fuscipes]|nr:hypothetical protein GQX74_005222 [Glossina fuscipes]